jgi:ADP-ribosyl-[dinitrogen reductase] hydrolase
MSDLAYQGVLVATPRNDVARSRVVATIDGMDEGARAKGSILGAAIGDALGAPYEFRRAAEIPAPPAAFTLRWLGLPPGTTTDDTALARNLCRSLVARGGLDVDDVLRRHLAWLASGPPDVGVQTRRVLARAAAGERDAARAVWQERGPEVSAGNGSVMYCAPLGVAYARRPGRLLELGPALSRITHWDERCATAVVAVTLTVAALVRGERSHAAVESAVDAVVDRDGGEELEFLVGGVGTSRRIDGPDMGFCLFTAAVALQAALRTEDDDVEAGLLRVVSLGGDTDTNAAVAGALLGAVSGRSGLPEAWIGRLADRGEIETEAAALATLARRTA